MRTGLAAACERALIEGARRRAEASRQQLRAAARRFVRRHRRDAGYLAWVLRSVGASSALAVALLGLAPEPAHAKATFFTGAADPPGLSPSFKPALVDLDGDGDLDLVGDGDVGTFRYLENTGSATTPTFVLRTGAANPLDGLSLSGFSPLPAPAFGDLDGDGDLDLVSGSYEGAFHYFENTGNATSPAFAPRTGAQNPLDGQQGFRQSVPAFGDLDGDGDLDLVSGDVSTVLAYFENTGDAGNPAFIARTGSANPLGDLQAGYFGYAAPAIGDLDGDGDLDVLVGHYVGLFFYFENTGNAVSPTFVWRSGAANPVFEPEFLFAAPALGDLDGDGDLDLVWGGIGFANPDAPHYLENRAGEWLAVTGTLDPLDGQSAGAIATPAYGDLDADGDRDLVAGNSDGTFRYFVNQYDSALFPILVQSLSPPNPVAGLDVGSRSGPALGDLDLDGDLDLVAGAQDGLFHYFENTGTPANAAFVARTGSANPLDGFAGSYTKPALADLDHDGDLDLVAGDLSGGFRYFENTGGATSPAFVERTGAANPLDGEDVGGHSTPSLGDVDGDGDLDLVAGEAGGTFAYFENTGSAANAAFVSRTGAANPLDGQDVGMHAAPCLGDLDDGDVDLLAGASGNAFFYFENAIVQPSLSAFELPGGANPLDGQSVSYAAIPALGDLDADGDLDLVVGEIDGNFFYFENTGSASIPRFAPRTGAANPLDGQNVGDFYSAPSLGDLDGDGDLDLVACRGGNYPSCRYFENTGSAASPAFVPRSGTADPLDGLQIADNGPEPSLGDLDRDGDLDLVIGTRFSGFDYVENTGTATIPAFVRRTGAQNPLDGLSLLPYLMPALGDVDGDGDLDLFAGIYAGYIEYYENTGTATSPTFVWRTGMANPLYTPNHNYISGPALGDLDGDGDLDVVAVESFALTGFTFRTFYLPEPGRGALLGAGLALLSWLARLRGRGERAR